MPLLIDGAGHLVLRGGHLIWSPYEGVNAFGGCECCGDCLCSTGEASGVVTLPRCCCYPTDHPDYCGGDAICTDLCSDDDGDPTDCPCQDGVTYRPSCCCSVGEDGESWPCGAADAAQFQEICVDPCDNYDDVPGDPDCDDLCLSANNDCYGRSIVSGGGRYRALCERFTSLGTQTGYSDKDGYWNVDSASTLTGGGFFLEGSNPSTLTIDETYTSCTSVILGYSNSFETAPSAGSSCGPSTTAGLSGTDNIGGGSASESFAATAFETWDGGNYSTFACPTSDTDGSGGSLETSVVFASCELAVHFARCITRYSGGATEKEGYISSAAWLSIEPCME